MRLLTHFSWAHHPSGCRRIIPLTEKIETRRVFCTSVHSCFRTATPNKLFIPPKGLLCVTVGRGKSSVANSLHLPSNRPLPSPLSKEELSQVITLLENDPRILLEVINQLDPENRRRLVVAGGAMEWFGADSAAQEVERADLDKDRQISPKDFDHWFQNALKRKMEQQKRKVASAEAEPLVNPLSSTSVSSSTNSSKADSSLLCRQEQLSPLSSSGRNPIVSGASNGSLSCSSASSSALPVPDEELSSRPSSFSKASPSGPVSSTPTLRTLIFVAMEAGLPFVGFGFLDNAAMILAGDAIDNTLGFYLNCSVLASAAMGNVCSGLLGMQVHGLIEKGMRRVFTFAPELSMEMMRHPRVFLAGHIGGTVGILIGLLLGMLPLLFLNTTSSDLEKSDYVMFQKMDTNNNGFVELAEFVTCLDELGVKEARERAQHLLSTYGDGRKITFEQFGKFRSDLRDAKKKVLLLA